MVLSNLKWMQAFADTAIEFLEGGISNHSLALVFVGKYKSFGPKPFKFFNFWVEHKEFLEGYAMF
jgi:hypothetical protein